PWVDFGLHDDLGRYLSPDDRICLDQCLDGLVESIALSPGAHKLVQSIKRRQEVVFNLHREWAAALVEFIKQIFHAVGQPRRRAEAHDASSTLEGMDTAPHLLEVVVLARGMAQAWQEAPDHVEMLLSFEEEAIDQLARYLIHPRGRRMALEH